MRDSGKFRGEPSQLEAAAAAYREALAVEAGIGDQLDQARATVNALCAKFEAAECALEDARIRLLRVSGERAGTENR